MEYQISKATLADLPMMNRLFFLTVTLHGTNILSKENLKKFSRWAIDKEYSIGRITDDHVYIAKLHGEVIGSFSLNREGVIDYIFVNQSYLGKGIAKSLYNVLEKVAKENNIKTLRTTTITEQTEAYYIKLGFDIIKKTEQVVGGDQLMQYEAIKRI